MRILEYVGLDTSRVAKTYRKVIEAIAADDFRAAQVKKLANLGHGKFYRARLDDANRLLFSLIRHQDEVCALILEVIANHDYDKSRFLRGAVIDETKIPDCDATENCKRNDNFHTLKHGVLVSGVGERINRNRKCIGCHNRHKDNSHEAGS